MTDVGARVKHLLKAIKHQAVWAGVSPADEKNTAHPMRRLRSWKDTKMDGTYCEFPSCKEREPETYISSTYVTLRLSLKL